MLDKKDESINMDIDIVDNVTFNTFNDAFTNNNAFTNSNISFNNKAMVNNSTFMANNNTLVSNYILVSSNNVNVTNNSTDNSTNNNTNNKTNDSFITNNTVTTPIKLLPKLENDIVNNITIINNGINVCTSSTGVSITTGAPSFTHHNRKTIMVTSNGEECMRTGGDDPPYTSASLNEEHKMAIPSNLAGPQINSYHPNIILKTKIKQPAGTIATLCPIMTQQTQLEYRIFLQSNVSEETGAAPFWEFHFSPFFSSEEVEHVKVEPRRSVGRVNTVAPILRLQRKSIHKFQIFFKTFFKSKTFSSLREG